MGGKKGVIYINKREKQHMKGNVAIILKDRKGNIIEKHETKNLIVSGGKQYIAELFRGEETKPMSHMAVGTGKTTPTSVDNGLENELSPRRGFDKNFLKNEQDAYLVLKDAAKKDVLKITSKLSGEQGNFTSVEVKKTGEKKFSLFIYGESDEGFIEEEYKDLTMNTKKKNYVENIINEGSHLISAKRIMGSIPVNSARTSLDGGQDTTLTLGATFGYEDCNGPITEGGIFNAEQQGVMYNRVVFPKINKTDKLTLSLIWKISF